MVRTGRIFALNPAAEEEELLVPSLGKGNLAPGRSRVRSRGHLRRVDPNATLSKMSAKMTPRAVTDSNLKEIVEKMTLKRLTNETMISVVTKTNRREVKSVRTNLARWGRKTEG